MNFEQRQFTWWFCVSGDEYEGVVVVSNRWIHARSGEEDVASTVYAIRIATANVDMNWNRKTDTAKQNQRCPESKRLQKFYHVRIGQPGRLEIRAIAKADPFRWRPWLSPSMSDGIAPRFLELVKHNVADKQT